MPEMMCPHCGSVVNLSGDVAPTLDQQPTDAQLEQYKLWLIAELAEVGARVITRKRAGR